MADDELIGTTEAARLLDTSVRTIHRMATRGTLPYTQKLPGPTGPYLFRRQIVELVAATQTKSVEWG